MLVITDGEKPQGFTTPNFERSVEMFRAEPWNVTDDLSAKPMEHIFLLPTHTPVSLPSLPSALMENLASVDTTASSTFCTRSLTFIPRSIRFSM
ncbi:hypothetical protein [Thermogymnomonas acidicola]|uniref:hypothetical protein n=1 Tax=Thermogymnomonas acidicola TaxID=399579 RepID=UPI001494DD54|nr:hypothetical protein [Thermogymnomonas acidicola]